MAAVLEKGHLLSTASIWEVALPLQGQALQPRSGVGAAQLLRWHRECMEANPHTWPGRIKRESNASLTLHGVTP